MFSKVYLYESRPILFEIDFLTQNKTKRKTSYDVS